MVIIKDFPHIVHVHEMKKNIRAKVKAMADKMKEEGGGNDDDKE